MTTISQVNQISKFLRTWKAQFATNRLSGAGRRSLIVLASIVAIICLCLGFSASSLHAQGYGTISGTVSDPSGAVIPGASVIATEAQTGSQTRTVTGKDGRYVFPTLLPSGYTLSVTAGGFESYAQKGIVLEADQALTINLVLKIGAQTQTVSVNAEAAHVDTTTGTLSQDIDVASVHDLPLNGRAAAQLVTLVAGVVDASNENNGANQGSGKTFSSTSLSPVETASVNGTLPNQDNFLLDGGNNLDEMTNVNDPYPMPDSVQEFSVQTSNYSAEFGQSAGAVINIVTKSGGEQFHGDLFEYLRNGFFNAENRFTLPGSQDTYHRHQFGGTIGGPVKIPHVSSGKTTQFFYGYQYTLIHLGSAANSFTAPTAAEEGLASSSTGGAYADFSNLCNTASGNSFNGSGICVNGSGTPVTTQQIYNVFATTSTPYPYNHVPKSAFDPASVALTQYYPVATSDAGAGKIGNTVDYFAATQNYFNEDTARVDHEFSANDHMFARYFYDWYQQPAIYNTADLESYSSYFQTRYQNAAIAETHTFTANILNNLVLNYQREVSQRGGPPGSFDITALASGSPLASIWQPTVGPYFDPTISGYFKSASSASAVFERNNYTFNDDIHWVKGQHNFAFGGHYELSKFDVVNVYNSYGIFDFATTSTISVANNNAFANYMEGFMQTFEQGEFELDNDRGHFPAIYADDSWKVSHRLTIDYGVRWEMFAPWHNKDGVQTAFSPSEYVADKGTPQYAVSTTAGTAGLPAGMVLSGDPGFPADGVNNQYKQFMPRVGFAYDLFGNGKTAIRGGYGIFYQTRMQGFFNLSQPTFQPNTITVGSSGNDPDESAAFPGGPFSDPYCTKACAGGVGSVANPFPFTLPFKSTQVFPNNMEVGEYDPSGNFRVPVSTDYNFTIEQQLPGSMIARLAYVGSASRHLFVNLEENPSVNTGTVNSAGTGVTFANGTSSANARRIYNTAPTVGPCITITGCNTSYNDIVEAAMIGSAHYNSIQATLLKQMSHGVQFMANYTWSKSIDDMPQATRDSNTEDLNSGESYVYPVYPANLSNTPAGAYAFPDVKALDRGYSDINHPQAFSVAYVWDLPKVHGGFSLLRAVVNDWNTGGTFQHHSGDALTIYTGSDISDTGLTQDRAVRNFSVSPYLKTKNLGGDCSTSNASGATVPKPCESWFNPAAFSIPVNTGAGTGFGNVVKDSLTGPGFTVWNTALTRTFHIWRESSLDFRAEYFDVLNHPILNNPSVSTGSSVSGLASSTSFGNIQTEDSTANNGAGGAAAPRIGQFALKYNF